jgi:hypothetical protein
MKHFKKVMKISLVVFCLIVLLFFNSPVFAISNPDMRFGDYAPSLLLDYMTEKYTSFEYFNREKGLVIDVAGRSFEEPSRIVIKILDERDVAPHPGYQLVSHIFSFSSSQPMEDGFDIGFLPSVERNMTNERIGIFSHDGSKWSYVGGDWLSGSFFAEIDSQHGGEYAVFLSNITFKDIDFHWAEEAIEVLAARQIANGFVDGNFYPARSITRAEFLTMLVKTLDLSTVKDRVYFEDVPVNHWASGYINGAFVNGLITGDNKKFRPSNPINREEMAVIIVRAQEIIRPYLFQNYSPYTEEENFIDFDQISPWAAQAVDKAHWRGLVYGFKNYDFRPQNKLTRAEAASIIYSFLDINEYFNKRDEDSFVVD